MASLALKCTAGVAAATALLAKRSLSHASRPAAAAAPITSPPRINFAVLSTVRGLREGHDAGLAAMASSRAAAGQPAIPLDLHYTSVDAADVDSVIARADVVLGEPKAVGPLMNAAPRLLWYQSTFAGVEHVFTHSDRSDFLFTRMGAGMNEGILEWVTLCLLAHTRRWKDLAAAQAARVWANQELGGYSLLKGKTVGILGVGTIGNHVAAGLKTFGVSTMGFKRSPGPSNCDVTTTRLADVLSSSDFIVNVLPSTPETRGLLSGAALSVCAAKSPVLLNCGRGDIIDEASLRAALDAGWISAACLDVFTPEPLPVTSALWAHPRVTITPHVACVSFTSDVVDVFLHNLQAVWEGGLFGCSRPLSETTIAELRTRVRYPVNALLKY